MSVILCVGENVDFERPFLFAKMHSKFLIFFKFSDPIPTFIKHCFHGIFDPFLPKISEKFTEKIPTFGEGGGSSRLGQNPNFYQKFVLHASLIIVYDTSKELTIILMTLSSVAMTTTIDDHQHDYQQRKNEIIIPTIIT